MLDHIINGLEGRGFGKDVGLKLHIIEPSDELIFKVDFGKIGLTVRAGEFTLDSKGGGGERESLELTQIHVGLRHQSSCDEQQDSPVLLPHFQ